MSLRVAARRQRRLGRRSRSRSAPCCCSPASRRGRRGDYLAGYLVEKSLSLDNVFVFLLVFTAFGAAEAERHRLLTYGIVGALVLRAVFIVVGAAALERVRLAAFVFAALPDLDGLEACSATATTTTARRRWSSKLAERGSRRAEHGRWALLTGAAALAASRSSTSSSPSTPCRRSSPSPSDTFIVFAANAFALLGLRPLFFLVAELVERLYYLKTALAAAARLHRPQDGRGRVVRQDRPGVLAARRSR